MGRLYLLCLGFIESLRAVGFWIKRLDLVVGSLIRFKEFVCNWIRSLVRNVD